MKKQYEELIVRICVWQEEIIRTSTIGDPFDDDYQDPNLDFNQ